MDKDSFLCGVIEGYYGRPWSSEQRERLFHYCQRFGLNSYVYAPKDDAKHRSRWRDLYDEDESNELARLIRSSKGKQVKFIYALSPGLDISCSSDDDWEALKKKFDQLTELGCEHWALLFDDIESNMSDEDQKNFRSAAHGQVHLTNRLFNYLQRPQVFLFCPTEYSSRLAQPSLEQSPYLRTIAEGLHSNIGLFWTGPKVVSRRLTLSHIRSVNELFKRRVTIWDNLNANDYDQRRLCLGPFSGRSPSIASELNGLLINPNCEFELNFVALNTLGQWVRSLSVGEQDTPIDQVDQSLHSALVDWLPELNADSTKTKTDDEPSKLTLNELTLLVHLFYLPYEHGWRAQEMFNEFQWLRCHHHLHGSTSSEQWRERLIHYDQSVQSVAHLLQRLLAMANRLFLYDVYHYILDMNSTLSLSSKYLHWLDREEQSASVFMAGDVEPWSIRGGLAGEFLVRFVKNLLPLGHFQTFVKPDPHRASKVFVLRPMSLADEALLSHLTVNVAFQDQSVNGLVRDTQMFIDRTIDGYCFALRDQFDLCFVVDGVDSQICGYFFTIDQVEQYDRVLQQQWIEELQRNCEQVDQGSFELIECSPRIYDNYPVRVHWCIDWSVASDEMQIIGERLLTIVTDQLIKRGRSGCHAFVDETDQRMIELYFRLGFMPLNNIDDKQSNLVLLKQF